MSGVVTQSNRPQYIVPTMAEIADLPWNGFQVASTFSGGGGSCLGYRMAGFKVVWANEFIPAAQATYKANHPDSFLDTRDIRKITPEEILQTVGLTVGDLDIFDGSPPCAAFSTIGQREKSWGKVKRYSDSAQRVDDLFFEYSRLLKGLQPKVFIAENVSGLIKGKAKGYFIEILNELAACGYRVKAKLLDASWLGVPQSRERIIFMGVRNDLRLDPVYPKPLRYRYTLTDAIVGCEGFPSTPLKPGSKLHTLYHHATPEVGGRFEDAYKKLYGKLSYFNYSRGLWDRPARTVVQGSQCLMHPDEARSYSIPELKRLCSFPDDFKLEGSFPQQWERLGRSVPPVMMAHIAKTVQKEILEVWKSGTASTPVVG